MIEKEIKIFFSNKWKDYELLDTGDGEKLESFGIYTFIRPYENAFWSKCATSDVGQKWKKVNGKFWTSKVGTNPGWQVSKGTFDTLNKWEMEYGGIKFLVMPTPFRHFGFFPEQAVHWDFIEKKISAVNSKKIKFLNLFGYTGLASLFALRANAEVTHIDASKKSLDWMKENLKCNKDLVNLPIRIIEDDVIKFLEREIKRGNKYDAIIMDPPKFGRGPKGEIWKLEENLTKLLSCVQKVLSDKPLFIILNSYAIDISSLSLGYALENIVKDLKGKITVGELCIKEKSNNRFISLANTAIWEN